MTINPDAIVDEAGTGNEKTVITTALTTPQTSEEFDWAINDSSLKYETKLTDSDRKDGYTDENGVKWGTGATVKISMKSKGNGLKHEKYYFDYCWSTKSQSQLTENDYNNKILIYPNEGQKEADGTIYVNSGNGKGHLYIRSENKKSDVKSISVNLDNEGPRIEINPEGEFATLDVWGVYNEKLFAERYRTPDNDYKIVSSVNKDGSQDGESSENAKLKFKIIDDQSGIYNKVDPAQSYSAISSKDSNVDSEELIRLGNYMYMSSMENFKLLNEIDGHPKYFFNRYVSYWDNDISGEYYLWTGNYTITKDSEKILLTDNVGNEIVPTAGFGPYNFDCQKPKLEKAYIGEGGTGKIVITDDFSGLSKDPELLKKIKYAWVKDKNTTPDSSSLKSIDPEKVDYTNENKFNKFNTLTATVDLPTESGQFYLYAYVDGGYKDISGNSIEKSSTVSEDYSGYATDLVVEVKEINTVKPTNPSTVEVKVRSASNGLYKISKIWWDFDGLDDKITYDVPISKDEKDKVQKDSFKKSFQTTVNGPIIVHVVDSYGNDYTQKYTVVDIQETILICDIPANKQFCLPCELYNNNIFYIDWGDGTKNYCNKRFSKFDFSTESKVDDLVNKNSPFHKYKDGNTERRVIKVSGNISNLIFTFYDDDIFGTRKDYVNERKLFQYSRSTIKEIKQFGIHNVTYMSGWYEECNQLEKIEISEENKNALKRTESLHSTFKNTNISEFPKGLLEYANNLNDIRYMFSGCKNLETIDIDIFSKCPKIKWADNAFYYNESLKSLPTKNDGESIFYNNPNIKSFFQTFYRSGLESIPSKLFASVKNVEKCDFYATFEETKITNIPDGLFSGINCSNLKSAFRGCKYLKKVSSKMWGEGANSNDAKSTCTSVDYIFADCESLEEIEGKIFADFTKIEGASDAFRNTALTKIDLVLFENCSNLINVQYLFYGCKKLVSVSEDIFAGCKNIKIIDAAFFGCSSLENVNEKLFNESKDVIKELSWKRNYVKGDKNNRENWIGYEGVFEECSKLKTCPKIWEWSNFNSSKVQANLEKSYDAFCGVNDQTITNGIKSKNLDKYWLEDHMFKNE